MTTGPARLAHTGDPLARHQRADLILGQDPHGLGYVLEGVPYGLAHPCLNVSEASVAQRHAAVLGLRQLTLRTAEDAPGEAKKARQAAQLALALSRVAADEALSADELDTLRAAHARFREEHLAAGGPEDDPAAAQQAEVSVRTDGSADKQDGSLSVGYTLGHAGYGLLLPGATGHEGLAEREAIRVALSHARWLGYTRCAVYSDHKFHVRRYDEDLIHRGRRKSPSLERLDALVDGLGAQVRFEYTENEDTAAPHRLAMHARALFRLAQDLPLSRAQAVAIRRVHFARKMGGHVLY